MISSAEYFARYNLGHDVGFEPYTNGIVSYTSISNSSRGANRPAWELLYSHYVQIKKMDAPWTTAYLNYSLTSYGGFEPGAGTSGSTSGAFDGLGWGSLLYHRDDNDTAVPTAGVAVTSMTSSACTTTTSVSSLVLTALTTVMSETPGSDQVSSSISVSSSSPSSLAATSTYLAPMDASSSSPNPAGPSAPPRGSGCRSSRLRQ